MNFLTRSKSDTQIINIGSKSISDVIRDIESKLTPGNAILSLKKINSGGIQYVTGIGRSEKLALANGLKEIPKDAEILNQDMKIEYETLKTKLEAFNELEVKNLFISKQPNMELDKVILEKEGKKGIIGFGKTKNEYSLQYHSNLNFKYKIQIKYRCDPLISIEIGNPPDFGFCQWCGKSNVKKRVNKDDKDFLGIFYFCDETCRFNYENFFQRLITTSLEIKLKIRPYTLPPDGNIKCWGCGHRYIITLGEWPYINYPDYCYTCNKKRILGLKN